MAWPKATQHPAFTPLHPLISLFDEPPDREALNSLPAIHADSGQRICFVEQTEHYEPAIHLSGTVATRDNWHDRFNALVWHTWPQSKAALNALHIREMACSESTSRTRSRDAATLFDECGMVVAYSNPALADALRAHHWHHLFVDAHDGWGSEISAWMFGHASFEHMLVPFTGLTAKCWLLEVESSFFGLPPDRQIPYLDAALAQAIRDGEFESPRALPPLPYLGIPGWWPQQNAAFYSNTGYFRPKRVSALPSGPAHAEPPRP
ncbi:DUF3025 domain-containing protein [Chitinibacteraceae bacterium HSL-7]